MRIGIDAMGGDRAPAEEVEGALAALELLDRQDRLVLVGDEAAILDRLNRASGWRKKIDTRHASEVIGMAESPVEALRAKPNSSIAVLAQMHKDGDVDACISAGNTGAFIAAAQMHLRRLAGVHRPGISIVTPTSYGPVTVCDVGANVNCRPPHLHQYGVMASVYAQAICGVGQPRVGLLSIGHEDAKGNELVKRTRELLKNDEAINFIGNVEGRDLFSGVCDVVVCEGFVGNVMLKLMEGMAEGIIKAALGELTRAMPDQRTVAEQAASGIITKYDFNEYGGAPLLGVAGICIICHGASDYRAIKNAVKVARDFSKHQVNQRIVKLLSDPSARRDERLKVC
ncbi:MAG: phosphate acyltransferase PlsX [Phycisphaerae bacterium]|nr:phosphate acyltransferase PlsX [Phycisphaerae bacterium]